MRIIPPDILLAAYRQGCFPMGLGPQHNDEIGWFEPRKRGIIPLDQFHIPHNLQRTLRKKQFEIRFNTAFEQVMHQCANRSETWINETIIASYLQLHHLGSAHSVETWLENHLVGGLYGVHIAGAFFGESMFHTVTDASKVALVALVEHLRTRDFLLLDTQWQTPHLARFGAIEIHRTAYQHLLRQALRTPRQFLP